LYLACQLDSNRQQIEHERGHDARLLAGKSAAVDCYLSSEVLEQVACEILIGTRATRSN
jgi:hypothetical protein